MALNIVIVVLISFLAVFVVVSVMYNEAKEQEKWEQQKIQRDLKEKMFELQQAEAVQSGEAITEQLEELNLPWYLYMAEAGLGTAPLITRYDFGSFSEFLEWQKDANPTVNLVYITKQYTGDFYKRFGLRRKFHKK